MIFIAPVLLALIQSDGPAWDLAKCQAALTKELTSAGHRCTPEHLEIDAAMLGQDAAFKDAPALADAVLRGTREARALQQKAASDLEASRRPIVRWTRGAGYSDEFQLGTRKGLIIATESVKLAAFVASAQDAMRIETFVVNGGKGPIQVAPESFSLVVAEPRSKARSLQYAGAAPARKPEAPPTWAPVAGPLATAGPWKVTPEEMTRMVTAADAAPPAGSRGTVTLQPATAFQDAVQFQKEKQATAVLLSIPVGDQTFEFPLEVPKEP